jgi:N utilization substance protein A
MKGMRVQSIIRELRGEKIDIIEFHEDPVTFAEKALQPAKVARVSIVDSADKQLEVVVDDTQLSLAIGKKGQNVRLAAKLLGWKIDIKSEEEKRQEVEQQMAALVGTSTPLENVEALGEGLIEKLKEAGITTVESLADMTPEQLEAIQGIGPKTVEKISVAVNDFFAAMETGAGEAAAEGTTEAGEAASAEATATNGETAEASPEGEAEVPEGEAVMAESSENIEQQAAAENAGEAPAHEQPDDFPIGGDAAPQDDTGPDSAGHGAETVGMSAVQDAGFESQQELYEEGQAEEAGILKGVEDTPPADVAEVTTHGEHPDESEIPPEEKGSS